MFFVQKMGGIFVLVRKAFLCGFDKSTGENFEHRREWVDSRILELATVFAIVQKMGGIFVPGC
ncbi:hypothetical protein ORI98_05210 [Shewanella sp. ULN5]|nr:hypothetical protein [Shewanella sp. ULN5]MDP5145839.1 hypothetical protein [Shewanella sp. ULN5]